MVRTRLGWLTVVIACVAAGAVWLAPAGAEPPPAMEGYPWLYLRDGQPPAADEAVVEVAVAGDVMLGRGVAEEADPLGAVAPWLRAADLAVANLESTIGQGGKPRPGPYRLQAPPAAAGQLHRAGLDLVSLANNHALDYGPEGLSETVDWLTAAGVTAIGVETLTGQAEARVVTVRGVRLAFLAFNGVPDPDDVPGAGGPRPAAWDEARATTAVAAARARADAVIVAVHWGDEYEPKADAAQERAARALLDAGADLVVGHHPHVVQDSEVRNGGLAAYSLGNLVFDQQQGETRQGLAMRAFFDRDGLRAVQALPLWAGPRPRLMDSDEDAATTLLARVQPPPERIAFACRAADELACEPTTAPERAPGGVFRAGEIDLTGDGEPEQVQVVGGKLSVYEGGAAVWRGLPEWQVADLALGDPNDDGRGEMMVALFKTDEAGVVRSHPFVAGYRSGSYRTVWGGSAVSQPIHEVELGDVDGDGREELVVLDESGELLAVSVWRWHGWGFSLLWRSEPGKYSGLAVAPVGDGQATVIVVERGY